MKRFFRRFLRVIFLLAIAFGLWWAYSAVKVQKTPQNTNESYISKESAFMADMPATLSLKSAGRAGQIQNLSEESGTGGHFRQETAQNQTYTETNAQIELQVANADEALAFVKFETENIGGKVQDLSSFTIKSGLLGYRLVLRLPAEETEAFMLTITEFGEKISESFSATDVTTQIENTFSEIENQKAYLASLQQLLTLKSSDLEQLLRINQEIARTTTQLERLERQQNSQVGRTEMATLRVTLKPIIETQNTPVTPGWSVNQSNNTAILALRKNMQTLYEILLKIIALLPFWGPVLVLFSILFYILREKKTDE